MSRHAGLLLPLFSAPSARSWGIGELPDLVPLAAWLSTAGFDRLMLLPVGMVAPGITSPYSAMSAMALDPIYVCLEDVPEFARAGGEAALGPAAADALTRARASGIVRYDDIRLAKRAALDLAFDAFVREEWSQLTLRASGLAGYISRERWWLDDLALYVAVAASLGEQDWRRWPAGLRDRDLAALDEARRELARDVLRAQYLQWIAETQWHRARAEAHAVGVTVFGDLPFMVSAESPDVWARPDEFMFDVSLGVPPDEFSETGQDWGLPTYRWTRIAATDFAWLRQRARRMAGLYDGYRVDHLVGLYRTYGRPARGAPFFSPPGEPAQVAQGETILRLLLDSGAIIVAEDLGLVPDFVRQSLARLGVPGCKVLRWERAWRATGQPFIDPATFPPASAALTGTHDTDSLAAWWAGADDVERRACLAQPALTAAKLTDSAMRWTTVLRDAMLELAYGAGSRELFIPAQDVFGWTDRINVPATVGDHNWTWRWPWPVDQLPEIDEARERARFCRQSAMRSNRGIIRVGQDVD